MSDTKGLINETIQLLRDVRTKVQGVVEDSVLHQLDEAILKLEETSRTRQDPMASQEALKLLGKAIKWLPAIVKLMELLGD